MNLICNGKEMNFYKSWISLAQKSETKITSSVQLVEEMLDGSKGTCKVEVSLLKESSSTNEFIISDSIDVKASLNKNKFNPEEATRVKLIARWLSVDEFFLLDKRTKPSCPVCRKSKELFLLHK